MAQTTHSNSKSSKHTAECGSVSSPKKTCLSLDLQREKTVRRDCMHRIMQDDPQIAQLIRKEEERIEKTLDLIAAESHSPASVMEALGSIFNTKTIEGYPGRRFHAGCNNADEVENIAKSRCRKLFGAEHVNVQPHSGTSANIAVYFSVLNVGDKILSMGLPHGGHLSHGHRASMTSKCFDFRHYGVDRNSERIDYDDVTRIAESFRPKMIVAGASAYPRLIDYEKMAGIAADISAYLFVDMAHIAGLVAAKVIPSPVPYSDFVSFTCYKTMMGGRGGVILCKGEHGTKIDTSIFPGCQGTSAVNSIAAKAVIFNLAMMPKFLDIQKMTLQNAAFLASELENKGYRLVSGGTETHQVLLDITVKGMEGNAAEKSLEDAGINVNRNPLPQDAGKPGSVSGIRLGSSAISARGMENPEVEKIAEMVDNALLNQGNKKVLEQISKEVAELCARFPVYKF